MINFFRKTRKKLADKNQFLKYSRYAIGEIILVMVGILLALQVNTWNEGRMKIVEEKSILENINAEFLKNKDAFDKTHNNAKQALNASKLLSSLIGSAHKDLSGINIDSLLYYVFEYTNLTVSENTLSDLTQSGKLQIIRSSQLKNDIYNWTRQKELINDNYFLCRSKSALLIGYLESRYSLKNVDMYAPFEWQVKSRLPNDKFQIFNELEFENILENVIYAQYTYLKALAKMENIIKRIILESSGNYQNL